MSTSAVGYYGFHGDEEFKKSFPGGDFNGPVAVEWEGETLKARDKGARVVITRLGIVMGEKGGALSQMIPLFKNYIGGPIGSGRQWFSWVHIKDLAEAFAFLSKHRDLRPRESLFPESGTKQRPGESSWKSTTQTFIPSRARIHGEIGTG